MAHFRPGIGKQDEDARDRGRGQGREQQPRVVGKNADVVEVAAARSRASSRAMPFSNTSQPIKPISGWQLGLKRQMLAAAEADLEPHRSD